MATSSKPTAPNRAEFVALVSSAMMLIALAIDSMLPALPMIGEAFAVATPNQRQFVVTSFIVGFGFGQIFCGTLSDRYGRRPLLIIGLSAYAFFSVVAAFAPTFELLLAGRLLQGLGGAAARVAMITTVRDRYEGRAMAQVMSLAATIFMLAPILAPSIGTLVMLVAPWRWIFLLLFAYAAILLVWIFVRLPESLHSEYRIRISWAQVSQSWRVVLTDRQSVCYTLALTFMTSAIFGFISSVQQVFADVFQHPGFLPIGFALMASLMAVGSILNARIVMRLGMRLIGHSALICFIVAALVHVAYSASGYETMTGFMILQSVMMFFFALTGGNFNAMAMEKMGHVAGTASSLQGSFSTVFGAIGGAIIGQGFNGTTLPLYVGIATVGTLALISVLLAERGRLFVSRHDKEAH